MAKPVKLPQWATTEELDPITGAPNKVEPTSEFKLSGLKRREPLPRAYVNYQFDLISDWIDYLDNQSGGSGSSVVRTSFSDAISADNTDFDFVVTRGYYDTTPTTGSGMYARTATGMTPSDTDDGSYFVDSAGNRFDLLHTGAVSIEQFGSNDGTGSGASAQKAIDYVDAKLIISERQDFQLDFPLFITRDNVEIDFSKSDIVYTGSADVYSALPPDPTNSVRVDRSVGVLNIRGSFNGSNSSTVTSSIKDGTDEVTVNDASWLSDGDFVLLEIVYPRKVNPAFMLATIENINGTTLTLDYTFGWEATSCVLHSVNVVENCIIRAAKITDNGNATTDLSYVSGIGVKYASNYKTYGCEMFNAANPALNTRYTSHAFVSGAKSFRPRLVGAGRGYSVQINESHHVHGNIRGGVNARHVLDLTYAAYCYLQMFSVTSTNGTSQIITHGAYEHDNVIIGGTQSGGEIGVNLAASDAAFGQSTKRVTLEGFNFTGRFRSQYAEDITVRNCNFFGDNMVVSEIEFGGQGDLTLDNVKCFNPNVLVRVRPDQQRARPMGRAVIKNCSFASELRFTYYTGDISVSKSSLVEMTCSQIAGALDEIPRSVTLDECTSNMRSTWNRLIASEDITVSNSKVHSDVADRRIRCQAPIVLFSNVKFTGGAGADATGRSGTTYLCEYFSLNGVTLINAINNSSPHFTHENSGSLVFSVANSYIYANGAPYAIDFVFQNPIENSVRAVIVNSDITGGINEDSSQPTSVVKRIDYSLANIDGTMLGLPVS